MPLGSLHKGAYYVISINKIKERITKSFRTRRSLEAVGFSESILSLGFSQATKYEMLFEHSEFIE